MNIKEIILVIVIAVALIGSIVYTDYNHTTCRVEMAKAGMNAAEILGICK